MSPFIKNGDILTLSPLSTAFPQKGDVVGVIDPGTEKLLVHRVVGMNNGRYWIKGDSAGKKEARSFELNSICGQVTRVERDGKPVRFGLGPEKRVIAVLSLFPFVMRMVWKACGLLRRLKDEKFRRLEDEKIGRKDEHRTSNVSPSRRLLRAGGQHPTSNGKRQEIRNQRTEVRGQKSEDGGQKTEDRVFISEPMNPEP